MEEALKDDTQFLGRGSEQIEGLGWNHAPTDFGANKNKLVGIVLILILRGLGRGDTANPQFLCSLGGSYELAKRSQSASFSTYSWWMMFTSHRPLFIFSKNFELSEPLP